MTAILQSLQTFSLSAHFHFKTQKIYNAMIFNDLIVYFSL